MEGIQLKYIFGIAIESAGYGVAETNPTFVLPATEFEITPVINQAQNESMFGSSHIANDMVGVTQMANFTATVKLNEDQLPLFFRQNFTCTSTTAVGESAVYQHTLNYNSSNTGVSYTIFRQDNDHGSDLLSGAKFNSINVTPEKGNYVTVALEGVAKFPVAWTNSMNVSYLYEMTSNSVVWSYENEGVAYTETDGLLEATLNHTFNLSADDVNFDLGSQEMDALFTTGTEFSADITTRFSSRTSSTDNLYYDFVNKIYKAHRFQFIDTTRFVTGSVANTRPSISFSYPSAKVTEWNEAASGQDIVTQSATLAALDKVGVSNAPLQIVVVNAVASYD